MRVVVGAYFFLLKVFIYTAEPQGQGSCFEREKKE